MFDRIVCYKVRQNHGLDRPAVTKQLRRKAIKLDGEKKHRLCLTEAPRYVKILSFISMYTV